MKTQIEGVGLKFLIKNTTLAGWTLLFRPIMYCMIARRRDINDYATIDFSSVVFIVYAVIAFFVGYNAIRKSHLGFGKQILKHTPLLFFGLYCLLGLASMAWSVNYSLTGFRVFECVAMALLITAVIQNLLETGNLRYVMVWSLLYCTVDTISALVRVSSWAPDIWTYLEASQMMATCFFFMALYFVPRRWYNYLIIVMSIFSASTVAYIGMALGAISTFWKKGKNKVLVFAGAILLLVVTLAVGPYAMLKDTVFHDKKEISLKETSGRDHLMDMTIDTVEEHPYGLGFFAAEPYVLYGNHFGAISAHNSLFSAGMGMGWPGIIVLSIFFIGLFKVTFSKYIPEEYRPIAIGCFCVAFLHCMGNPSVGTRVFGAWMPCMYIFVLNCGLYIYGKYYETIEYEIEEAEIDSEKDLILSQKS